MKKSVLMLSFFVYGMILLSIIGKSFRSPKNRIKTEYNKQESKYEYEKPKDLVDNKNLSNEKKAYFDYLYKK